MCFRRKQRKIEAQAQLIAKKAWAFEVLKKRFTILRCDTANGEVNYIVHNTEIAMKLKPGERALLQELGMVQEGYDGSIKEEECPEENKMIILETEV